MNATDVMTRDVATCREDQTAADAARVMWDRDCGVVPVVDRDGKLRGIVTDRDLLMAAQIQGKDPAHLPLSSFVRGPVATCRDDADLPAVLDTMADRQIRRVPIVDRHDRLVGIVSINDVALRALGNERHMNRLATAMAAICRHREPAGPAD